VPRRPTITFSVFVLPCTCSLTVARFPVPVTAALGTVTPLPCLAMTVAAALIPGLTLESCCCSVTVAS
jgi:hypothetical protein